VGVSRGNVRTPGEPVTRRTRPPGIELDGRERTFLDQAARQADDIAALEAGSPVTTASTRVAPAPRLEDSSLTMNTHEAHPFSVS
jgi:hypothetical protein